MKVAVLGGGVVGVATAYFLAMSGASVVLIERHDDVAREASAVNAGLISPGHTFTWASPKAPRILWRSLLGRDTALRMHWKPDLELYRWGLSFLANCRPERVRRHTIQRLRLAQYSKSVLDQLATDLALDFDKNDRGAVFIFRSAKSMAAGIQRLALLQELGEPQEVLDPAGLVRLDPAFGPVRDLIAGAVYSPSTSSGNSAAFARELLRGALHRDLEVRLSTTVKALDVDASRVRSVITDRGRIEADKFVVAMGVWSRKLLLRLGVTLPIYPVKGYTLTAPVISGAQAPSISGIDEDRLVAWSRFGDLLRMTGTADFNGYGIDVNETDARSIFRSGSELFPTSIDWHKRDMGVGLRPVTSSEVPLLAPLRKYPEVYLNTGHGNLGWVMAAGSGRIVADLVMSRRPALDPVALGVD